MTAPRLLTLLGLALLAAALWWRRNPSACPYGQRLFLELPHVGISRDRLRAVLEPVPGERILEVGPGTGYYSVEIADRLASFGRLDLADLQDRMLDHTLRRAAERGLRNVEAHQADARELPFPDATFDAAYLVAVLGEVPDQDAALRELARVLKPGGRLVVGEIALDPHVVTYGALVQHCQDAGLQPRRRVGGRLAYFARFERPGDPTAAVV